MWIDGYDAWKTRTPVEQEPVRKCNCCGVEMYDGDLLYTIDGGICEDCLIARYETYVEVEE